MLGFDVDGPGAGAARRLAAALGLAAAWQGCLAPDPVDPPDDDDSATPGPLVEASAVIGPGGGSLSLSDGTAVVVPEGAVEQDTEFTLTPVEPEQTPFDGSFVRVGTPFVVSPDMAVPDPARFEYLVPAAGLPEGMAASDVVLVASSDGLVEPRPGGEPPAGLERVHPMWAAVEVREGAAVFRSPALPAQAVFQPMVLAAPIAWPEQQRPGQPGGSAPPPPPPPGLLLGSACSTLVDAVWGAGSAPAGIDSEVSLEAFPLVSSAEFLNTIGGLAPADAPGWTLAANRFGARACLSAFRAARYYDQEMDFHPVPRPVPITARWSVTGSAGSLVLGSANGLGIDLSFTAATGAGAGYEGYVPETHNGDGFVVGGWNSDSVPGDAMFVDLLDFTVAHEVFHYVDDWANLGAPGFPSDGIPFVTESAAEALAEEVFDGVPGSPVYPFAIWNQSLTLEPGYPRYLANSFWRFLDWTDETPGRTRHPVNRLFDRVRGRSLYVGPHGSVEPDDLDPLVADTWPSRSGATFRLAVTEYASAMIYGHDFERWTGEGPPSPGDYDRYPDAVGQQRAEDLDGRLWGRWASVGSWEPAPWEAEPLAAAVVRPATAASLPLTSTLAGIAPFSARAVVLGLQGVQAGPDAAAVSVGVTASDASGPCTTVAARLWARSGTGPGFLLWSVDALSAQPGSPSTAVVPPEIGTAGDLVLVLVNVGADATVQVVLDEMPQRLLALGRDVGLVDTLRVFDVTGTTLAQRPLGPAGLPELSTGLGFRAADVCRFGEMRAFVGLTDYEVAVYDLAAGLEAEVDTDSDPQDGTTRIDLSANGLSEPRGVACAHHSDRVLVAARGGIAVLHAQTFAVQTVVPDSALGVAAPARPYRVEILPDDSKAYVTVWNPSSAGEHRILSLDLPAIFSGATSPSVVLSAMERSGDASNGRHLAASRSGLLLALTLPALNATNLIDTVADEDWDVGGAGYPVYLYGDPVFESPLGACWSEWGADDAELFVGYTAGYPGGSLGNHGVVQRCRMDQTWCDHAVGVECTVRALDVLGPPGSQVVWVADACGYLTALPEALFAGGTATSGWTAGCADYSVLDWTGGCVDAASCPERPVAVSCTDTSAAPQIGMPAVDLVGF